MNEEQSKIIKEIRQNPIRYILFAISSFIVGQFIESAFGDQIQSFFKDNVWKNNFFLAYCLPFIIGIILPIVISLLLFYILFKKDAPIVNPNINLDSSDYELLNTLKIIGIVDASSKLSESKFEPQKCMNDTKKRLYFMGISGSKWIEDFKSFEAFLRKIESKSGEIRFLLLNPNERAFKRLKWLRDDNVEVHEEILRKLKVLETQYKCLNIKLYDSLPRFRIIKIDDKLIIISRYRLDKEGYLESKKGWENPHIAFSTEAKWSFYELFESYFEEIWDSSISLESFDIK